MKKINQWRDTYDGIDNYLYELSNGLKVIHSINKKSVECNVSIVVNAGSKYEEDLNVPQGTAHFLEHVVCNPNNFLSTKESFDSYTLGTKSRPGFFRNAATDFKYLYFFANGNKNASIRILRYLKAQIDYPTERFEEFIEKERNIILGELERLYPEEHDSSLNYDRKFLSQYYKHRSKRILGTKESISSITSDHLAKYYKSTFNPANIILTIQTPGKLSVEERQLIKEYSKIEGKKKRYSINRVDVTQKFEYGYFKDDRQTGLFISIGFFYPLDKIIDYKKDKMSMLLHSFFWELNHQYLREEKQLIYGAEVFNVRFGIDQKIRGFKFTTDRTKLVETLDAAFETIYGRVDEFFESKYGIKWFKSLVSDELFKRNTSIDQFYAESNGTDYFENTPYLIYDFKKAKQALKELEITELQEYAKSFLKEIQPRIWMICNEEEKDIIKDFKKTKFYKTFTTSSKHIL